MLNIRMGLELADFQDLSGYYIKIKDFQRYKFKFLSKDSKLYGTPLGRQPKIYSIKAL